MRRMRFTGNKKRESKASSVMSVWTRHDRSTWMRSMEYFDQTAFSAIQFDIKDPAYHSVATTAKHLNYSSLLAVSLIG